MPVANTLQRMAEARLAIQCLAVAILAGLVLMGCAEGASTTITITDVGGEGCYPEVTLMEPGVFPSCDKGAASCHRTPVYRSGSLAPFDEELTMVFQGPIELSNLAVYYPEGGDLLATSWTRESYWDPTTSSNLVWFNNLGGGASGEWSICGGNSQSYASANGSLSAASPQQFTGHLDHEAMINALTAQPCTGTECGQFFRPVSNHGWGGPKGAKAFVVRLSMPYYTGLGNKSPAFWILNAKIVHTAQFGCNCRETGPKGCGELDVLEVLVDGDQSVATSTIYSFRGAIGSGDKSFARPTTATTYAVIFDPTEGLGRVQMTIIDDTFNFPATIAKSTVDEWNSHVDFTMSMANRVPDPNPYPCPANSSTGGGSSSASRLASFLF